MILSPAGSLKPAFVSPSADMDKRNTAPSYQNSSCTFCQRGLASLPTDFQALKLGSFELLMAGNPKENTNCYRHTGRLGFYVQIPESGQKPSTWGQCWTGSGNTQNGLSTFCLINGRLLLLQDAG